MNNWPTKNELQAALSAAGAAHHEYESNFLAGKRDEQWVGWYAAYVLGRLGDFTALTQLTAWLEKAPLEGDWTANAAALIILSLQE